jgi:hypothetical protein
MTERGIMIDYLTTQHKSCLKPELHGSGIKLELTLASIRSSQEMPYYACDSSIELLE